MSREMHNLHIIRKRTPTLFSVRLLYTVPQNYRLLAKTDSKIAQFMICHEF